MSLTDGNECKYCRSLDSTETSIQLLMECELDSGIYGRNILAKKPAQGNQEVNSEMF